VTLRRRIVLGHHVADSPFHLDSSCIYHTGDLFLFQDKSLGGIKVYFLTTFADEHFGTKQAGAGGSRHRDQVMRGASRQGDFDDRAAERA
jgi:hypothetical protein